MSKPKVSVIIPVYNAEKTIGNILKKLISQRYSNIEVIAVNDGSQDGSLKILQEFARKDERVVVVNQNNAGASTARNVGIEKSTGEFITFVDADDNISEELIPELASRITDKSDFIMCGMTLNGKEITVPDNLIDNRDEITRYVLKSLLTKNLLYGPCCKLFRRKLVDDNGIVFPAEIKYGEDTIFVLNYVRNSKNLAVISKALYNYNFQSTGLAASNGAVSKYRASRSKALDSFVSDVPGFKIKVMHMLLKVRWSLAYTKALLRRNIQ